MDEELQLAFSVINFKFSSLEQHTANLRARYSEISMKLDKILELLQVSEVNKEKENRKDQIENG